MRNAKPLPLATPPAPKVTAKEAHRKIRELTEAVARGHRVRQGPARELEVKAVDHSLERALPVE